MNQICISDFQYFHQDTFSWFKKHTTLILLRMWNYMCWLIHWEISNSFSSANSFPEKKSRSLKRKQIWKTHCFNSLLKGMVVFWDGQECWEECQDERLKADAEGKRSAELLTLLEWAKKWSHSLSNSCHPQPVLHCSVPCLPAHTTARNSGSSNSCCLIRKRFCLCSSPIVLINKKR